MLESERTVGETTSIERRYYITSLVADAALWAVEFVALGY